MIDIYLYSSPSICLLVCLSNYPSPSCESIWDPCFNVNGNNNQLFFFFKRDGEVKSIHGFFFLVWRSILSFFFCEEASKKFLIRRNDNKIIFRCEGKSRFISVRDNHSFCLFVCLFEGASRFTMFLVFTSGKITGNVFNLDVNQYPHLCFGKCKDLLMRP